LQIIAGLKAPSIFGFVIFTGLGRGLSQGFEASIKAGFSSHMNLSALIWKPFGVKALDFPWCIARPGLSWCKEQEGVAGFSSVSFVRPERSRSGGEAELTPSNPHQ